MAGKEYKQISCRDVGADCDFMVRAETEEEVMRVASDHGCRVHNFCDESPEMVDKVKSLIKNVYV
jgi:predicted small metal-binding protein